MLSRRKEESSVYEWVPLEYVHHAIAEDTGHTVHLVRGVIGENEASSLVISDAAFILHLDVVGVDLGSGQHIEGAVVSPTEKDATSAVMSRPVHHVGSPRWDVDVCWRGTYGGGGRRAPRGGARVGGGHGVRPLSPRWRNPLGVTPFHCHLRPIDSESREPYGESRLSVLSVFLLPSPLVLLTLATRASLPRGWFVWWHPVEVLSQVSLTTPTTTGSHY